MVFVKKLYSTKDVCMSSEKLKSASSISDMSLLTPVTFRPSRLEKVARKVEELQQAQLLLQSHLAKHSQPVTSKSEVHAVPSAGIEELLRSHASDVISSSSISSNVVEKIVQDISVQLQQAQSELVQLQRSESQGPERKNGASPTSISSQASTSLPDSMASPSLRGVQEDPEVFDLEEKYTQAVQKFAADNPIEIMWAVGNLVTAALERNKVDYAISLVERNKTAFIPDRLYIKIVQHLASKGDMDRTLQFLSKISPDSWKEKCCENCVDSFTALGNVEASISILTMMDRPDISIEKSALAFARRGNLDAVHRLTHLIKNRDDRDRVLQQSGQIQGIQVKSQALTVETLPLILAEIDGLTDLSEQERELRAIIEQLAHKNMMKEAIEVVDTKLLMLPPHVSREIAGSSKVKRQFLILQETVEEEGKVLQRTLLGKKIDTLGTGQNKRAMLAEIYRPGKAPEQLVIFKPRKGDAYSKEDSVLEIQRDYEVHRLLEEKGVRHLLPLREISYLNSRVHVCTTAVGPQAEMGDLSPYVGGGATLDPLVRLRLAVEILESISDMHQNGLVHGDIKSPNILLTRSSSGEVHAVISDFGSTTAEGTSLRNSFGTYPAPEVFEDFCSGKLLARTAASDKWNMADLLLELSYGRSLFDQQQASWHGGVEGVHPSADTFRDSVAAIHKAVEEQLGASEDPCDRCIVELYSLEPEKRPSLSFVLQEFEGKLAWARVQALLSTIDKADKSTGVVVVRSDFQQLQSTLDETLGLETAQLGLSPILLPEEAPEATISIGWVHAFIDKRVKADPANRERFKNRLVTLNSQDDPIGKMVAVQLEKVLKELDRAP